MKLEEIKSKAKVKNIKLIEFEDIDCDSCAAVKYLDDFLDIAGNIIGYNVETLDAEEATEVHTDCVLQSIPNIKFREFLENVKYEEIYKLCKSPAIENIRLLSIEHNIVYKDSDAFSKERYNKIMEKINKFYNEWVEKSTKERQEREKAINDTIDDYKKKYQKVSSIKDKEALIRELSAKLFTKFGIDGRAKPEYRKEMLKLKLEE